MEHKHIANLNLTVEPAALREIVSSGRLLEFANTAAAEAATQINAQLVQHVAEAAVKQKGLEGGATVNIAYEFVVIDGEPGFGTVPRPGGPRPLSKSTAVGSTFASDFIKKGQQGPAPAPPPREGGPKVSGGGGPPDPILPE